MRGEGLPGGFRQVVQLAGMHGQPGQGREAPRGSLEGVVAAKPIGLHDRNPTRVPVHHCKAIRHIDKGRKLWLRFKDGREG